MSITSLSNSPQLPSLPPSASAAATTGQAAVADAQAALSATETSVQASLLTALAAATQSAAAQQDGLAPLMANVLRAAAANMLPREVQSAVEQLVALHLPTDVAPDANTVKSAVTSSGLFTEAMLSTAQAPKDVKTALLQLNTAVQNWLNRTVAETPAPVARDANAPALRTVYNPSMRAPLPQMAQPRSPLPPQALAQPHASSPPPAPAQTQTSLPAQTSAQPQASPLPPAPAQTQASLPAQASTQPQASAQPQASSPLPAPQPDLRPPQQNDVLPARGLPDVPQQTLPARPLQTSAPGRPADAATEPVEVAPLLQTVRALMNAVQTSGPAPLPLELKAVLQQLNNAAGPWLAPAADSSGRPSDAATASPTPEKTPSVPVNRAAEPATASARPPQPAVPVAAPQTAAQGQRPLPSPREPLTALPTAPQAHTAPAQTAPAAPLASDTASSVPQDLKTVLQLLSKIVEGSRAQTPPVAEQAAAAVPPDASRPSSLPGREQPVFPRYTATPLEKIGAPRIAVLPDTPEPASSTAADQTANQAGNQTVNQTANQAVSQPANPSLLPAAPSGMPEIPKELKTLLSLFGNLAEGWLSQSAPEDGARPGMPSVPPPRAGAPVQAQAPAAATLPQGASEAVTARHLLQGSDAALARQTLLQIASLPDAQSSPANNAQWRLDVPLMTPQGPAVAQLVITRDGSHTTAETPQPVWRVQFAIDIEPLGPVRAHLALSGGRTWVTITAERPGSLAKLKSNASWLTDALHAAPLDAEIAFQASAPAGSKERAARFVDHVS